MRSRVALDLDAAHRSGLELLVQVVADLPVLDDELLVVALLEPARLPVRRHAEAETVGVYLLAHLLALLLSRRPRRRPRRSAPRRPPRSRQRPRRPRRLVGRRRSRRPHRVASTSAVSVSASSSDLVVSRLGLGCLRGELGLTGGVASTATTLLVGPTLRLGDAPRRGRPGRLARDEPALEALLVHASDDDRDVARALADPAGAAARTRGEALHGGALVGVGRRRRRGRRRPGRRCCTALATAEASTLAMTSAASRVGAVEDLARRGRRPRRG